MLPLLPIISGIAGIASKFIADPNKRMEFEAEIKTKMEDTFKSAIGADKDIKLAELRAGGIAAKWRPIAAISIFATLFLHWFILPLVYLIICIGNFNVYYPTLAPLPLEYYGLALSFISIYAYGRSREKEALNLRLGK